MAVEQTPELERYLQDAADRGASDLFLLPDEPPTFRVAGCIERGEGDSLSADDVQAIAVAALGEERLSKIGGTVGVVTTSCGLPGVVGGRLSVARAFSGYTVVVSILPSRIADLTTTAVPDAMVQACLCSSGLVIFAGLVGSGKTTAAYSVLDHINATKACHICTVEEPISLRIEPKRAIVQQREVGVDVPDCPLGIGAALRQDLDVLFVGEMKSLNDIAACINTADIGHMVITHVHAAAPEAAIQRVVDCLPDDGKPLFLRSFCRALRGVSAQRLLPKASGKGRVAAYGVLIPDDEMRRAVLDGRHILDRTSPLPEGCQTMAEDIERLRREGAITEETARQTLAEL